MNEVHVGDVPRLLIAHHYEINELNSAVAKQVIDRGKEVAEKMSYWTNNPFHIVEVPGDKVRVWNGTKSALLSEHPDYNKWVNEFDSCEFYSMVGKDWVK